MKISKFSIASTIVHYVPTLRDGPHPELLLTSAAIDLDTDLTNYFSSKVTDRLEAKGLEVIEDPDRDQTVPNALAGVLQDPSTLVDASTLLARRLFEVQSASNSSGLLAVLTGTMGPTPCVAVVKLERQRGVSFEIDASSGTVDLALLRNLTLTDKTKVYKTALFEAGSGSGLVAGLVADDQRTSAKGRQVAGFFLGEFLGCKPKEPAAYITYQFVKAANGAINDDVESPETRGKYQVALLSTLQDNTTDINPTNFAKKHLEPDHRSPFLKRVEAAGIDPKRAFAKDTSRIKLDEFRVTFSSGMLLVGPSKALSNNVVIPKRPGPTSPVELKDTVESVLSSN